MFTFVKERSEALAQEFTPFVAELGTAPLLLVVSVYFKLFLIVLYYTIFFQICQAPILLC